MSAEPLLTPNEVAALAQTSPVVVEKALEQRVIAATGRGRRRLLPMHAVALAATVGSLGRRLNVADKRLLARKLGSMSPAKMKTAEIEVTPAVVVRVGIVARDAIERAERYTVARDAFIETAEGVQGGRPVIRGTRLTVSAICGRLAGGDTIDDLVGDYPDIPREAFETADLFGRTHPPVGRPARTRRQ